MKRKMNQFMIKLSVVVLLVMVIGGTQSLAANADRTEVKITNFKITNEEGVTQDRLYSYSNFILAISWDASDYKNQLKAGDYFLIDLPNNFRFPPNHEERNFDVYAQDKTTVIAKAVITTDEDKGGGQVKVTFTDYVESRYDIKGDIDIQASLNRDQIKYDEINNFTVSVNAKPYATGVMIDTSKNLVDEVTQKWGVSSTDGTGVNWTVRINHAKYDLHNVIISDQLTTDGGDLKGVHYKEDSFLLREVEYDSIGNITKIISETDISSDVILNADKTAFTYNLGQLEGDQYNLKYKTTYVPGLILKNKIELSSIENNWSDASFFEGATSEGKGSGILIGKIKIVKVDGKDNATPLEGATFEVMNKETKESFTMTTDDNGEALSNNLIPGEYVVKEVTAPKGYDLDSTMYNVVVTSGETVIKTMTNKETGQPTEPTVKPQQTTSPKTGDEDPLGEILILALMSLGVMVGVKKRV